MSKLTTELPLKVNLHVAQWPTPPPHRTTRTDPSCGARGGTENNNSFWVWIWNETSYRPKVSFFGMRSHDTSVSEFTGTSMVKQLPSWWRWFGSWVLCMCEYLSEIKMEFCLVYLPSLPLVPFYGFSSKDPVPFKINRVLSTEKLWRMQNSRSTCISSVESQTLR